MTIRRSRSLWLSLCLALTATAVITSACESHDHDDNVCRDLAFDVATCTPAYAPTWSNLYTNLFHGTDAQPTSCNTGGNACHGSSAAAGGEVVFSGDSLSTYNSLVPHSNAGNPACSHLYNLLSSDDPAERMPLGGTPLSEQELCTVAQWLAAGAPNN